MWSWYALLALLACLLPAALVVAGVMWAYVLVEIAAHGYAQLTLGPLWVMVLPGYVAVSW